MKITAKVVYKNDTHRRLEEWLGHMMNTLQYFVEENDIGTAKSFYTKIQGIAWAMCMADCITLDRYYYIEHKADKVMGWA